MAQAKPVSVELSLIDLLDSFDNSQNNTICTTIIFYRSLSLLNVEHVMVFKLSVDEQDLLDKYDGASGKQRS